MDQSYTLYNSIRNSHRRNERDARTHNRYIDKWHHWHRDRQLWNFRLVWCHGNGNYRNGRMIIITLLAGGMLETIRYNGGIDFIIQKLTRHVNGKRGAGLSIAALVSIANLCTANNTIAIITTGPIAKDIAVKFHLDRRKTASILDTFSCLIQGIIPYGAQMLIAAGLASISPISIIGNLYYPFTMGVCALLAILFRYPKRYS